MASNRMSRQEWERIKVEDFERLEADLTTERARADALAVENAELRAALDINGHTLAMAEAESWKRWNSPETWGNTTSGAHAWGWKAGYEYARAALAATGRNRAAADELADALDLGRSIVPSRERVGELIDHYRRLCGGRVPEGGAMTTSGLCEACLSCARARSLEVVYVYPSGHMLRPADIPGLSEWPARRGLTTFCGLPITGKEASRLYDLTR
jgi:hypothetical protein